MTLSACSTTANLFPVEGPLTEQTSVSAIVAKVDGIAGNTGNFSLTLPNGSLCNGKWSSVAPTQTTHTSTSLFTQYGTVAGYSRSSGNVPGVNRGMAFATCTDNTRIDAEFFTGSGTANGFGVAKDTNGNVYKMIF